MVIGLEFLFGTYVFQDRAFAKSCSNLIVIQVAQGGDAFVYLRKKSFIYFGESLAGNKSFQIRATADLIEKFYNAVFRGGNSMNGHAAISRERQVHRLDVANAE